MNEMPIQELQKAQETYDSIHSSYTADEEDIQNIRNFCKNQLELKDANSKKNKVSKPFMHECKKCKEVLIQELEESKNQILKIDETHFLHLCIRKRTNNITFELLRDVFKDMNESLFLNEECEDEISGGESEEINFIQTILKKLEMMTKALTKTIKISSKIPREHKNIKIIEAPSKIKQVSLQFAENTEKLKELRGELRDDLKIKKETVKTLKKNVEEYLIKANVNNQRVAYENNPYQLIRKVSVGKPKLKLQIIESCLQAVCHEILQQMKKRPKSVIQYFLKNKKKMLDSLEEKLIEIPQESKSSILLRKLKEDSTENWTMEEDEVDDEEEMDSKDDFEENSQVSNSL
jgi:hypothetical protein